MASPTLSLSVSLCAGGRFERYPDSYNIEQEPSGFDAGGSKRRGAFYKMWVIPRERPYRYAASRCSCHVVKVDLSTK